MISKDKEKRININATRIEKPNNLKNILPSFSNSAGMYKSESSTTNLTVTKVNFNSSGNNLKTSLSKKLK
jgi:hypothetical protein